MKTLEFDYTVTLDFDKPVTDHHFLLRCVPISQGCQVVVARSLAIEPYTVVTTSSDVFGNRAYQGYIASAHSKFSFHSVARVLVDGCNGIHARCPPLYKYGTPLTHCSDEMRYFLYETFKNSDLLSAIKEKHIKNTDIKRFAKILMNAVHNCLIYTPKVTDVNTTASQAFVLGKGVCQDYSHIFCSLCREAGVASRYVAGTTVGEGATHAWSDFFVPYESYLSLNGKEVDGRWFGADCTRNNFITDDYCILSTGRDYSDCKVDAGVFRGNTDQCMSVFVKTIEQ